MQDLTLYYIHICTTNTVHAKPQNTNGYLFTTLNKGSLYFSRWGTSGAEEIWELRSKFAPLHARTEIKVQSALKECDGKDLSFKKHLAKWIAICTDNTQIKHWVCCTASFYSHVRVLKWNIPYQEPYTVVILRTLFITSIIKQIW